jgi:hypothetical protein
LRDFFSRFFSDFKTGSSSRRRLPMIRGVKGSFVLTDRPLHRGNFFFCQNSQWANNFCKLSAHLLCVNDLAFEISVLQELPFQFPLA